MWGKGGNKIVKQMLVNSFVQRFGSTVFRPAAIGTLDLVSHENRTEFSISLRFDVPLRHGEYRIEPSVQIRWRHFEKLYYDFQSWYLMKNGNTLELDKYHPILVRSFSQIILPEHFDRMRYYVSNLDDAFSGIVYIQEQFEIHICPWIRNYFYWEDAYSLLKRDTQLCGAWRDFAMFTLADRVVGRETACHLLEDREVGAPQFIAAQIEYLRREFCETDRLCETARRG